MISQGKNLEVSYRSVVILRVLLSLIFIVASLSHLFKIEETVQRIEQAKFGALGQLLGTPTVAVIGSGMVMLIAGVSLLIGFKTRYSAILFIAVLVPITIAIQIGQIESLGPLFKNIAILGGLLFFSMNSNLKKYTQ